MHLNAKYVHTNLVAADWRRLAGFYETVFGCLPAPPERHLAGKWVDAATGISEARIQGLHLHLPGCGEGGPTLEIFQYAPSMARAAGAPNRPGFGHIAFQVDDVHEARKRVLAAGGGTVGEVVTAHIDGAGEITFAYLRDPEGNIVEVQSWRSPTNR